MSKILVIGGTGFVGKNLLPRLKRAGHVILALSRTTPTVDQGITWISVSHSMVKTVSRLVAQEQIDIVIHLAGRINGRPEEIVADNVNLTCDVLAGLENSKTPVQFIYLSSVSAINSIGSYGSAKRSAEKLIADCLVLSRWNFLRSSLIYGPGEKTNVGKLVKAVRYWPFVPVISPRIIKLQPLYVDDLCHAIEALVEGYGRPQTAYVVAGPRQEYLVDMIHSIAELLGKRPFMIPVSLKLLQKIVPVMQKLFPFLGLPVQQIMTLHDHPAWDSSEAVADLGFSPRDFQSGIREYI